MSRLSRCRLLLLALALGLGGPVTMNAGLTVWQLDSAKAVAGFHTDTWGQPSVVTTEKGSALTFDGVGDGVLVGNNPIAGYAQFTIEILFQPSPGGPRAQRFLHLGEPNGNRVLVELRMNDDGQWFLDTFISSGDHRRALADSAALHAPGEWHWAALTYDGVRMTHFVNGRQETDGPVNFTPLSAGKTSIGVRMTAESWFKGAIREIRFHDRVVPTAELKHLPARQKVDQRGSGGAAGSSLRTDETFRK